MKKSYLVFIVATLVLISAILWFYNSGTSFKILDNLHLVVIFVVVFFAVFIGVRRFTSERRGEPSEDELSKKIMQKASSASYYISLYLWLLLMYIADKGKYETDVLFGSGILGMALIFFLTWVFFYFRGLRNE
ncbi:MAG: hypothetical protein A2X64_01415 [Ignavibacteria bacterium GWF2_33_9]|nr:MAG: hypothetical protein A2X64_01415 [Ignavibacteria bacterium GWF2_33_9]